MTDERDWWGRRVEALLERIVRAEGDLKDRATRVEVRDLEERMIRRMDNQDRQIGDLRTRVSAVGADVRATRIDMKEHFAETRKDTRDALRELEARQRQARRTWGKVALGVGGVGVAVAAGAPEIVPGVVKVATAFLGGF